MLPYQISTKIGITLLKEIEIQGNGTARYYAVILFETSDTLIKSI